MLTFFHIIESYLCYTEQKLEIKLLPTTMSSCISTAVESRDIDLTKRILDLCVEKGCVALDEVCQNRS